MEYNAKEILKKAVEEESSDIFFIAGSPYAFMHNGVIVKRGEENLKPEDCEDIIRQIYDLDSSKDFNAFLESGDDDYSFSLPGVGRFRVNAYRQRNSLAAVLRVVKFGIPDYKELGIPEEVINLYNTKKGMIIVSGPAGSGKSTTLACIIDKINENRSGHIVTLEDPIEFLHSHKKSIISQREIYHDSKSYLGGLRAALRETPEVILLGEMRDPETIATAITAAETGHLVLTSLHTVGAVNTIDRILDTFTMNREQIRMQLSQVVSAIVSEQLVPTVNGDLIPVFEIMKTNTAIRSQIRENKLHLLENTMLSYKNEGMMTMDDSLYELYIEGVITLDTALAYCVHRDIFERRVMFANEGK